MKKQLFSTKIGEKLAGSSLKNTVGAREILNQSRPSRFLLFNLDSIRQNCYLVDKLLCYDSPKRGKNYMECNHRYNKTLTAFVSAIALMSLAGLSDTFGILQSGETIASTDPSARFFQLLFILFIISLPLIVILLFLIWRELKARNRMK